MKVLLINPIVRPWLPPTYFPLGLAYIAGVLIQAGHEVQVLDINAQRMSPVQVQLALRSLHYDMVGITGIMPEYQQVQWLANLIREQNSRTPIVLGGGLATLFSEWILNKTEVDIVVIGEGETTVVDVVHSLEYGNKLEAIEGIAFKQDGVIVQTTSRPFIEQLDEIPFVAYGAFPIENYIYGEKLGLKFPIRSLNMIASRGCPYSCIYCYHGIFGNKVRSRSPENVIREMQLLSLQYNVEGIAFSDDTFMANRKWIMEFCNRLIEKDTDIFWTCNGRVDLVDEELAELMKRAGCRTIFFGLESGSQQILDIMRKNIKIESARKAVRIVRQAGIEIDTYFMIGMPGETPQTVGETVKFRKELSLPGTFNYATPLPGTALYEWAVQNRKVTSMEGFLEEWEGWQSKSLCNLTTMPDDNLSKIKEEAEKQLAIALPEPNFIQRWVKFVKLYGFWIGMRYLWKGAPEDFTNRVCKIFKKSSDF